MVLNYVYLGSGLISYEEYYQISDKRLNQIISLRPDKISLEKFKSIFIEENNDIGNESFIANETSLKIDANKNLKFKTRKNKKTDLTEYYNLIYQYKMDCLTAGIEYKKD